MIFASGQLHHPSSDSSIEKIHSDLIEQGVTGEEGEKPNIQGVEKV